VSELTPGRPDRAVAAVLAGGTPVRVKVSIDLTEFRTNRIVVGFDGFGMVPSIGDLVTACDLVEGREATAEVLGVNDIERIASIVIDWTSVREVPA